MRIQFGSTLLASTGATAPAGIGPFGRSVNGQQFNDEAGFFRAVAASFFPRGNRRTYFEFSCTWVFNSSKDCDVFMLSHFGALSVQADLTVYCGDPSDETPAVLAAAVPDQPQITDNKGCSCTVKYGFLGGLFTIEDSDPAPDPDGDDTVKLNVQSLTAGTTQQAITFDTPFGTIPRMITLTLDGPSTAADNFTMKVVSRTVNGFIASFGAPVPATGYNLLWKAEP